MAFIGLVRPTIAKLDESAATPRYTEGFTCGEAIEVTINPQYAEGSLFGDDRKVAYAKEFKNADVTLNTTTLPIAAHSVMFGHTVDAEKKNIKDSATDTANYVGFGIYVPEDVGGVKKYVAMWLYKAKFTEGQESYKTKGDNIEFQTPSISGQAVGLSNGEWREREICDTEEAAQTWLDGKAGITTPAA